MPTVIVLPEVPTIRDSNHGCAWQCHLFQPFRNGKIGIALSPPGAVLRRTALRKNGANGVRQVT
jgi:hypothetical protein